MNEAHESCDGCKHDLGGGRDNCRLNLSYECRDGGGFEAWNDGGLGMREVLEYIGVKIE